MSEIDLNQEPLHGRLIFLGTNLLVQNISWFIFTGNVFHIDHGRVQILHHPVIGDNIFVSYWM